MTEKEAFNRLIRIMGTFDLATGHADTWTDLLDNLEEELRDMRGYLVKRIKELEGEREKLFNAHSVEMTRADVLNQRIEELEKDLHMVERHYDSLTTERTQYRELSDEEIKEVANNIVVPMSLDYDWRIAFARAILRKAQGK